MMTLRRPGLAMNASQQASRSGFTIIELLLAMAIVGVLAGVAVVAINPARQFFRVQEFGREYRARQIENAILQYMVDHNDYPGDKSIPDGEGQARHVCRYGRMESQCVNIDELIPKYMTCMPYDDAETDEDYSGFSIYLASGRVRVSSLYVDQDVRAGGGCEPFPSAIAYWKLDENSGSSANNSVGGNNAAYAGSSFPTPSSDTPGISFAFSNPYSLKFADAASHLVAADIVSPKNSITISIWFKWETDNNNAAPRLIARAKTSTNNWWELGIDDASDTLRFRLYAGGGEAVLTAGSAALNIWTHVAATYNGSQMCIYKNGIQAGCQTKTGLMRSSEENLVVWMANSPDISSGINPFKGLLDDIRIYAEPLSQGQIEVIATGGV